MNYLNITKYIYLFAGLFFMYDAYTKWHDKTDEFWLSLILGGASIVLFFVRNKFAKKFADRKKQQNNSNPT